MGLTLRAGDIPEFAESETGRALRLVGVTFTGVAIKLGLQIPNFSYGTSVAELFPTVIAQAQEAEAAGFDSVFLMDHFYQLPGLGAPEEPMLEAYTALGALSAATQRVQLGTLVTGNSYRNPTLLAKAITTLDVASQGRAILGIGTGWFELEHDSLGYEFGTFTDRFNKLGEALDIILPMLSGERVTVDGKYYKTQEAFANPRFRDHIPLMIGGSGEKKTIPLAAKHFDHLNIIAGFDELPRKVQVVADACEKIGRDPATLETSVLAIALIDENVTADMIPDDFKQQAVFGSPEQIAEQVKTKVLDAGVDGVILSAATINGYKPGGVTAVAELLKPVLGL
jgi:F420-dependent oxidoreductase-like protein